MQRFEKLHRKQLDGVPKKSIKSEFTSVHKKDILSPYPGIKEENLAHGAIDSDSTDCALAPSLVTFVFYTRTHTHKHPHPHSLADRKPYRFGASV